MLKTLLATAFWLIATVALPSSSDATEIDPVTIHAGKAGSPYYTLAKQLADAVADADRLDVAVAESQSSVQNVMEAAQHGTNSVFTAPPSVIQQAKKGEKPFTRDPHYNEIRALFTIPFTTMHWVVREDSGVRRFADLAGKSFIPGGRGSFGERQTVAALKVLGLEDRVGLIDIDVGAALPALKDGQVVGVALAGAFPLPAVTDIAAALPVRLLGFDKDELAKVLAYDDSIAAMTIPGGTYPGIEEDVTTVALPVGVYTTQRMSEDTAYALTKAFWTRKAELERSNPHWAAVTPATLSILGAKLHRGALRYYKEAGIAVPAALR